MILKNKKANKMVSVYWFAILFIVAAAIVYMVLSFYGKPYDIREVEAHALTNKIAGCLSEAGVLNERIFKEGVLNEDFKENFIEECKLIFEVEDAYGWREQGQYYVEVGFYDFSTKAQIGSIIKQGNLNLVSSCGVETDIEEERIAKCVEREFYSLDDEGKVHLIKILSIVRKIEKNIKV